MRCLIRYYDSIKPLVIQVVASHRGLVAGLLQAICHIELVSKSLTEAENHYSSSEGEMLGIVFGLERFHQYVYGWHVEVHTGHKLLDSIYTKQLFGDSPGLARMLLRIQQYDVNIRNISGSDVKLADALSRVNPCDTRHIRGLDV